MNVSEPVERRRLQRVKLIEPLAGSIDGQRVFLLDVSRHGIRIAHRESLGASGDHCVIEFEWDGRRARLECRLTHSKVQRAGTASYARSLYHSGFTVVAASPESERVLRGLIAWHVERALDEQKANARGIPAVAASSYQTGKASELMRHVFSGGVWRQSTTTDARQPVNGFTIAATQTPEEVQMLRSAWEAGDGSSRAVIQRMAELSISRAEGIPTRRYTP